MKVRLIVPANTSAFNDHMRKAVEPILTPDVELDVTNITGGIPHIESQTDFAINTPYVIDLVKKSEAEGYQGIFVSDFDFCGVEPSRENVNIPVIGGFRPSALTAISLSEKVGVITIVDSVVPMQEEHFRNFGILNNLACILPTNIEVHHIGIGAPNTIDAVYNLAVQAIDQYGAQSIILGCTGFIGVADPVAKKLSEKYGVYIPVLDPNRMGMSYLINLVRNKISQSQRTYFPYKDEINIPMG